MTQPHGALHVRPSVVFGHPFTKIGSHFFLALMLATVARASLLLRLLVAAQE